MADVTSAKLAALVVEELLACGVRDTVLCPGSRNAPMSYALHHADGQGRLRLHVRIDERGAGFLALGLAAAQGRPVPVCTTSGTAAANLHPAVLEAAHRGIPLITLTADRPAELVGTGANQTTDQVRLFGPALRWYVALDSAIPAAAPRAVDRAVGWSTGALSGDPGPVQINLAFRDPLVAPVVDVEPARPVRLPPPATAPSDLAGVTLRGRTVVVAGDGAASIAPAVRTAAERHGWPLVAEASAGLGDAALPHGPLLVGPAPAPDSIVVVGTPTLHRPVQALLRETAEVTVVARTPRWADPAGAARHVVPAGWLDAVAAADPVTEPGWLPEWAELADVRAGHVAQVVDLSWPSGLAVARAALAALPSGAAIQLGSSNPVRDVDLAARPRADVRVIANRGLAGIDGTLSSAIGLALSHDGPTYALVGDLTFLHDITALLLGPREPRTDLTVVVVDDDGGGIFSTLEQGDARYAGPFERVFGTPTGADLAALCAGTGVTHRRAETADDLAGWLAHPPPGIAVVQVRADRRRLRDLHAMLAAG
jgi:2-succinyl-5-enolpyruvyl-6-hydroxy-3-cyclohexene-1-carboxylate synthase